MKNIIYMRIFKITGWLSNSYLLFAISDLSAVDWVKFVHLRARVRGKNLNKSRILHSNGGNLHIEKCVF